MSSEHSAEFKAKVALEAVSRSNELIAELAKKYDVSEDEIRAWTLELQQNAATVFGAPLATVSGSGTSEISDVTIDSDDEVFIHSVDYGVQDDSFNYQKLFFWSGIGIATVIFFVIALVYFAQYSFFNAQKTASETSSYLEITNLEASQNEQLNSFGVINLEDGVYRIPIDEAINNLATD